MNNRKNKITQEPLNQLEPFRSQLAGKKVLAEEYEFHFFRTHPRGGGLEIRNIKTGKIHSASYSILVSVNQTCTVRLNLKSKPFNIPYYIDVNFDELEAKLRSMKVLLPILL